MKQEFSKHSKNTIFQSHVSRIADANERKVPAECTPGRVITVVDDDPIICEVMETLLTNWKYSPFILPEPFLLDELLKTCSYSDIFLLDVRLPSGTTLNWIPQIMESFPESKVIIMTGFADTDTVIQAIRNGAFDFLQKPVAPELMQHSLNRAIQMVEKERKEKQMLRDLQEMNNQLLEQKQRLEFLNERLLETNRAFSTLAQNLDFERIEILNRINQKIESSILPALARIRTDHHLGRYGIELDIIVNMLQEITSGSGMSESVSTILTTAESRVASLIKQGLTTDKIAEQLFISVDTVKTHRKNIRKKLNITNSQSGLKDFLSKKLGHPAI